MISLYLHVTEKPKVFHVLSKLQGNFVGSNSTEKMQTLEGNSVDNGKCSCAFKAFKL